MRRSFALLAALSLTSPVVALFPTTTAHADVVDPLTLVYNKVVYGNFALAGNSVEQCPTAASPVPQPVSVSQCAAAGQRSGPTTGNSATNSDYFMQWSDVDNDSSTYNSSSATVTIPAGASVSYARLSWGGAQGQYQDRITSNGPIIFSDTACGYRGLLSSPNGGPSIKPPGTPDTQAVQLQVGSAPSVSVAPAEYTAEAPANSDPTATHVSSYYSADADVTATFAEAPTGSPITVTVGNVWAPQGFNCFGGWSIIVVYDFGAASLDVEASARQIYIYDGHIRQFYTDPPTETTVSGFQVPKGGQQRIGVTGYEGDWGIPGDQLLLNGTAVADPQVSGSQNNFFLSATDGQVMPTTPNNMSTDADTLPITSSILAPGDTSLTVTLRTAQGGDNFVAQNFIVAIPMPELAITKSANPTVAQIGDTITYTITVTNIGEPTIDDIKVADDVTADCSRPLGSLAAGQSTTYTCSGPAPSNSFVNTAKATGTSGPVPVSAEANAAVGGAPIVPVALPDVPGAPPAPVVVPAAMPPTGILDQAAQVTSALPGTGNPINLSVFCALLLLSVGILMHRSARNTLR